MDVRREKPSSLPLVLAVGAVLALAVAALFVPLRCPGSSHPTDLHANLGMFYGCSDCRDTGRLTLLQRWVKSRRVPVDNPLIY